MLIQAAPTATCRIECTKESVLRAYRTKYGDPSSSSSWDGISQWRLPGLAVDAGRSARAQWLGNDFLLVSGSNLEDSEEQLASDPTGLELIDTRSWTAHVLAPDADSFTVANGVLLVTGARWRGNVNPTGMGLEAYGPDAARLFALFPGRDVWVDHAANGHAYVAGYGWKRERVVDLRSGRIIGTTTAQTEAPLLLLGRGSVDDW